MSIGPDGIVLARLGPVAINATLAFTWAIMALLVLGSWLVTRRLSTGAQLSRWQNLLEVLVTALIEQIREIGRREPGPYLPFVGTLFVYIAAANLLAVVPGYVPPTASLSTTTALAIAVFVAVPLYGIAGEGALSYLRHYIRPTLLMLPFNVIGELSRTVALAVRLYGNVLSGTIIAAVLLGLVPFFFPVIMQLLGLITGMIQAYIFAVLAMVYIASATSAHARTPPTDGDSANGRPADADPANARPADARPADARPADARPADGRPADARPADARPADGRERLFHEAGSSIRMDDG